MDDAGQCVYVHDLEVVYGSRASISGTQPGLVFGSGSWLPTLLVLVVVGVVGTILAIGTSSKLELTASLVWLSERGFDSGCHLFVFTVEQPS